MQLGLYYRVSSLTQKENETIEIQRTIGREYARRYHHNIVREYEDNGISGTTLEQRDGMLSLLADAERRMFEAVWVMDLDRFDRSSSSLEWAIIKDTLQSHQIVLVTPTQSFDFTNDNQEFLADILNRVAALERKKILQRMHSGKWAKTRTGKWNGGRIPLGYYVDENDEFQIDEEGAQLYLQLVTWAEEGDTLSTIVSKLHALGVPSPRGGKEWSRSTVQFILTNELYTGTYTRWQKNWGRKKGVHRTKKPSTVAITTTLPALIDHERWEGVVNSIKSNKKFQGRYKKHPYLLSGLVYCNFCHGRMTGEIKTRARNSKDVVRQYTCHLHRSKQTTCPHPRVDANELEQLVWDTVYRALQNPELIKKAMSPGGKDVNKEMQAYLKQLEKKQNEEERLLDLYTVGGIDKEMLEARIAKSKKEQAELSKNVSSLREQFILKKQVDTIESTLQLLKEGEGEIDFAYKARILRALFYGQGRKTGQGVWHMGDGKFELRATIDLSIGVIVSNESRCIGHNYTHIKQLSFLLFCELPSN